MLRPFLLIGVGGSGGKTLRVVREDLSRRLVQAGWTDDIPQAWQFLHIDVPTHADGDDPDLPAQLPLQNYRGLVSPGLNYHTIDAALAGTGRTAMGDAIAGWRPDPNTVNVAVSKGAGQFRTLGRVITVAGMDRIREALGRSRQAITGTTVIGQLQQLTRVLGGEALPSAPEPTVIVVASIAGGSGAGAVIDVCDAVRSLGDPWSSESVGILYAPDVFDYLPEDQRRGVRPNALATLAELLSGYWNTNGPAEETASLLAQYGVQLGGASRLGPRYPFIVGNRNEHVSFSTQNDIYHAMGRSLASWVASGPLQDRMVSYVQGNWSSASSSVTDHLPLRPLGTEAPFSALGSARVGLGRDRFLDYASEALARGAVEILLRRQEEYRLPDDDRIPAKLVADVAETNFGGFLAQSGLDERGEDKNDIIDALRPLDPIEAARELANTITAKVCSDIPQKGWAVSHARQRILSELHAREARFQDDQRTARLERARVWVVDVQERLTRLAAVTVAREGAPVAAELIDKLATELRQVKDALRDEASRYRRWATDIEQHVAKALEEGSVEILLPTTPSVSNAVKRGVEALVWQAESNVRELAAELIPDLVDGLVMPLAAAVKRAGSGLAVEETARVDGRPSVVARWPVGDHVPQRLLPAANEFLLEPLDEYPATLTRLVMRTVGSSNEGAARREATMQIMLGAPELTLDESLEQRMVRRTTDWISTNHLLHSSSVGAPVRAVFDVKVSAEALLERAVDWIKRPATAIGTYADEGLKAYLDPSTTDPAEHAKRLQSFEGKFIAAINAAAPLVDINAGVLVQVHGVSDPQSNVLFTEIPFPDRTPGRETVRRVLQGRGLWSEDVAKSLTDGSASYVDVFSVLGTPYEPVVFDSLIRPIASEWGARSKTPDMRSEFWRWRRARPLTEFLPLAPAIRRAMIRGWFTATLLGQVDLDRGTIFVPTDTGGHGVQASFPSPLLTAHDPQAHEYLPVVLESILLALVDVNTRASLEPMRPYVRLRNLGRSGRGGEYESYDTPMVELEKWIIDGATISGAPPVPDHAGTPHDDWEKRRVRVEERFACVQAKYTELFARVEARKDVFDLPAAYELRHDIMSAFDDLQRAVRNLEHTDSGSVWN